MRPCANSFFCENEFHLHANGKKNFTSVKGFTLILRNGQFFICTTRVFPPIAILLLMFEISSGIITKTFPMTLPLGRYVYLEWSKSGFISDRRSHGSWFMKGNDTSLPSWSKAVPLIPLPPLSNNKKSDLETMTGVISLWLAQNNLFSLWLNLHKIAWYF